MDLHRPSQVVVLAVKVLQVGRCWKKLRSLFVFSAGFIEHNSKYLDFRSIFFLQNGLHNLQYQRVGGGANHQFDGSISIPSGLLGRFTATACQKPTAKSTTN